MTLALTNQARQKAGPSITADIARFAADTDYPALPSEVIAFGKVSILDTLGVAFAGAAIGEGCDAMMSYASAVSQGGPARVWASGKRMPPALAAFCNAAHARCLDYDDIIENPQIHVAVCVVPTAFAMAEALNGPISGQQLLTAVAIGSEIQSRLASAIARTQDASSFPVMLSTQVFGYFAAAATAGHLLDLDTRRMQSALGLAMMQATGTEEMVVHAPESVGKCIYASFSNQGGIQAAMMAAHGVSAPGAAFEGQAGLFQAYYGGRYHRDRLSERLGRQYCSTERCFKMQPGTLVSHAFVEAALIVMRDEGLSVQDIFETRLRVGGWGRAMCEPIEVRRDPPTAAAAMNSIPFIVAKAMVNGKVALTDFQAQGRAQPEGREMAQRIRFIHDPALDNPAGLEPGLIEIVTNDGRVFSKRVDKPRGHPSRAMSFDEVAAKFRSNAAYATTLTSAQIDQMIETVDRMELLPDLRSLLDLMPSPSATGDST